MKLLTPSPSQRTMPGLVQSPGLELRWFGSPQIGVGSMGNITCSLPELWDRFASAHRRHFQFALRRNRITEIGVIDSLPDFFFLLIGFSGTKGIFVRIFFFFSPRIPHGLVSLNCVGSGCGWKGLQGAAGSNISGFSF